MSDIDMQHGSDFQRKRARQNHLECFKKIRILGFHFRDYDSVVWSGVWEHGFLTNFPIDLETQPS